MKADFLAVVLAEVLVDLGIQELLGDHEAGHQCGPELLELPDDSIDNGQPDMDLQSNPSSPEAFARIWARNARLDPPSSLKMWSSSS